MTTNPSEPLKLFYCYAHEDKTLRDELDVHLTGMKRLNLIKVWYDREILAGTNWEQEINTHLSTAHIILLLVSARFLASDYCYGIEMQKALQRDAAGTARVVPILLRPVDWEDAPFSHLQILPTGAKPVTRWTDHNDAFEDVAKELRKVVKALQAQSKTKKDWIEEGNALFNLQQYEEALTAYNHAVRLDSNYALAYSNIGSTLNNLQRFDEALVALDKAIRLDPNDARFYNNKGIALNELQRYGEALIALNEAVRLDPNDARFYNNKGIALQGLQRDRAALVAYDRAIQLNPNNAAAYNNKGFALDELQRYDEALVAYDHAIQLDPNYVRAYNNKGITLQKLNRNREAQAAFTKAKQLDHPN